MIKKYLSLIFLFCCFCFGLIGYSQCSDLFISEYIEGSSSNKYIEIYNPTNATVTLTEVYDLQIFSNGSNTANQTIALSGNISAFDVFLIAHPSADLIISPDQTGNLNFNGNDAVVLRNDNINIDVIGQIGLDPGTEWTGTTCTQGTQDGTLVRNSAVQSGDADGSNVFNPDTEWTCFAEDDISDLGSHTSTCLASNEIQLQLPLGTDIACGYTNDFGTQNIGFNSDVIVRIQNTGTLDLDITDLSFATGTNFTLVGTPAVPFSIAGGAFQDITVRFTPDALGLFNNSLTITNTDSNEGSCLINLQGEGTTTCETTTEIIAAQDFESAVSDTWNYTANHAETPNFWFVTNSLGPIAAAQSNTNFWGITDLERAGHENQTHELIFDPIDVSAFSNVELSFYYYTEDVDSSDELDYEISYDGIPQGRSDISANTSSWANITVNIPDNVNNVGIIFYPEIDAGPGSGSGFDQIGIDNISLTSTNLTKATWDGTNWNWNDGTAQNTLPTLATTVVIEGNYDTSVGGFQTSFSACSLTINTSATLRIANDTFIEIQNDIISNGNITVESAGSVVQINDSANTIANGIVTVQKMTTVLNSSQEYTYWSSPVTYETIENTFANVSQNRRFLFNAANFVDLQSEIGNSGTFISGQDDIDDDNNAWQFASGTMIPGVGYATFAASFGMFPAAQQFTFLGAFNNGIIQSPIINNSSGAYNDWNFIGNPYPSAIDTNVFFSVNSGIVNNIYLWNHATPADSNATGSQVQNFSSADYAVITASGVNTAGGDLSLIPDNFVPSGQGFFIEAMSGTNITFNNSMRVTSNNSQFFRGTNSLNKQVLWINLRSDNGVAQQIAVAHIEGATDGDDGTYYDVKRNESTTTFATIFSTIIGSDKKLVVQGKAPSSLDSDEVITLGFNTSIDVATLYTISIAQFEGSFLNANNIYLKDNLLNIIHNLKDSDYNFTSEVGEFNDRFEIVFRADVLSVNDNQIKPSQLTLVELPNGNVEISVNQNVTIKNVEILDITGRQIYRLTGNNSTEVYNLSKLSKATYIARVTLSNGQTITKKAIKQN